MRSEMKNTDGNNDDIRTTRSARYLPEVFNATNLEDAKKIILTPIPGTSTEERWIKESEYLIRDIGSILELNVDTCVIDYGCGVGRLAKGLIERYRCGVVGVDTSVAMRQFAPGYVQSSRFWACAPESLDLAVKKGFTADGAICVWVLQHCLDPVADIGRISDSVKRGGRLYVLNNYVRAVPTDQGWLDDGADIRALLKRAFAEVSHRHLPLQTTIQPIAEQTFIGVFEKR